MFETAILDDRGTRSRRWTMAAATLQMGFVGVLLLIPLVAPEHLQMLVKQASISMQPMREPPPVQTTNSASSTQTSAITLPQTIAARPLTAPSRILNRVAAIIDSPSDFLAVSSGPPQGPAGPFTNTNGIIGLNTTIGVVPPPPPEPVAVKPATPTGPVRVGGTVMEAKIVKKVLPVYPALAKQIRISGSVRLEGVIAKDGTIQKLKVLSGHPLLVTAAVDAVRQWVYSPTQLNGQAVEVIAPIDVNFILNN